MTVACRARHAPASPVDPEAGIIPMLRKAALFAQVGDDDLRILAASAVRVHALRKQILFRQGDRCDGLHVIVYGRIKMSLLSSQGVDRAIQLIGEGGTFSDITLLAGDRFFLNVQALEDSLFLFLPGESIIDLVRRDGGFAMAMLRNMAARVHDIIEDIDGYTLQRPTQRLVRYLLRCLPAAEARDGGGDGERGVAVRLPISKNVMAAHLHLTPETLSRSFRALSGRGLLAVNGRTVVITDVERLHDELRDGKQPRRCV